MAWLGEGSAFYGPVIFSLLDIDKNFCSGYINFVDNFVL